MDLVEELRRRIEKKKRELEKLQTELRDGEAYLRALEDTYRLATSGEGSEPPLRAGSDLAKTQEIIKKAGRPMHINEILTALGKTTDKKVKESLSGSLSGYARDGRVFTKEGPNRFGLIDLPREQETKQEAGAEPPDDFGGVDQNEAPIDVDVPF